ncbi:MAG: DUF4089 domain-containing protein [Variovorax sp.]|nr:MAG: DUF4089 domain-containing protein [Variovorax sp.]
MAPKTSRISVAGAASSSPARPSPSVIHEQHQEAGPRDPPARGQAMSAMTPAQIERYVEAAAAALNLRVRPDHRAGVLCYFALAAEFAAVVEAVPLGAHDEPAVNFTPVAPPEPQE